MGAKSVALEPVAVAMTCVDERYLLGDWMDQMMELSSKWFEACMDKDDDVESDESRRVISTQIRAMATLGPEMWLEEQVDYSCRLTIYRYIYIYIPRAVVLQAPGYLAYSDRPFCSVCATFIGFGATSTTIHLVAFY